MPMNDKILDFVKTVGVPAAIALVLAYVLVKQMEAQAADRHDYALQLMQQISEVQDACEQRSKPNGVQ
jgi:hypothetical protein